MASESDDSPTHRRNRTSQGIPLQTLHPNGVQDPDDEPQRTQHRRTLSDRGRALFRSSRQTSPENQRRYAPIGEDSPSPPERQERMPLSPHLYVSSPSGERSRISHEEDEGPISPVADRGAFQSAIGFAGLSFSSASQPRSDPYDDAEDMPLPTARSSRATRDSLPRITTAPQIGDDMVSVTLEDGPEFFSPGAADEEDTQPLTDSSHLRPSTLAAPSTPDRGQGRQRSHSATLTVRFPPQKNRGRSGSDSRLGDDLQNLEAGGRDSSSSKSGLSHSVRKRSLSPASLESPLARTGTMLRNMSQRVVNLSHEPKLVEQAIRRKSSVKTLDREDDVPPIPSIYQNGDMANDEEGPERSPVSEKAPSPIIPPSDPSHTHDPDVYELPGRSDPNPLRGKSLSLFSRHSKIRQALLSCLIHPVTEPLILLLIIVQTVILSIDSAGDIKDPRKPRRDKWGVHWTDYTLFAIFAVYTVETIAKIIVSGFLFNPSEYSTIDRSIGLGKALNKKANDLMNPHRKPSVRHSKNTVVQHEVEPPSLIRAMTMHTFDEVPGDSRAAQKKRLAHRAYLRHSFNRLDFVAVVSFWISFSLNMTNIEWGHRLYVFKMMSCLRILRLLNITSGTSVILRSLKRAAPSLLNIGILIGFFWLLFGIVGVQSFKSSLRRTCVWDGSRADPPQSNYTLDEQFCGGWWEWNGTDKNQMPWLFDDGRPGAAKSKGYVCPIGSWCIQGENPYNNTLSFDNVGNSMEQVFVVMTSNTFTDIMYQLADTDYLVAALYYAFGIIILYLWLLNLLIAVISSAFQVIREESRSSAFMAREQDLVAEADKSEATRKRRSSGLRQTYEKTRWLWILVIVYGLVAQSMRHDTMSDATASIIGVSETIVTLILAAEIVFRIISDWRDFPGHRQNWVDLGLAIITMVIQIPPIRNSGTLYSWLTIFQIVRIYRVVLAVPITRDLILLVLRHVSGVLNLILFVFLLTFLAAIFATQLFRGVIENDEQRITFGTIFNSFLGMYQVLSTENWTTILYAVTESSSHWGTAWIGAIFLILWFILANFITLNMFIAVIQENFDVSEDQKRLQQVRMFLQQKEMGSSANSTMSLSTIFKFGQARRQDPLDFGNATTEMLMKDAVVREFLDEVHEEANEQKPAAVKRFSTMNLGTTQPGFWTNIWAKTGGRLYHSAPNPFYARLQLTRPYEELDPRSLAREVVTATEVRKVTQREYLRQHPNYNNSLFVFKPTNPIRRLCQRMVGPGRGSERIEGVAPNPTIWYAVSAFVYCAIVAMVLLACVTTPLYQKEYFVKHEFSVKNWFVFTDIGFAALFTVEAIIKVIADGALFTPNAYFRSSWGLIDGIVLCTLWASVITYLTDPGSGSRAVGAFKALRALRLLNVSDSARNTFHSLIVLGIWKLTSAALVSLSLLIPFAIYGLNLFAGQFQSCNDGDGGITNLNDCVGEFKDAPYNWDILVPRVVSNDFYDFDSFGGSLFILFQIVSQEGWTDVMWSGQSATGIFTQPNEFATQGNAVYFVIFNLLGAVFILTLFVSVFMRNYSEQTGVAFLTAEQRSWLELRKLLRQVSPSKRPSPNEKRETWQEWCYRRAVTKNGRWQRGITALLVVHLILLMLEYYPEPEQWSTARDYAFLLFTLIYTANIAIRIVGLSWVRFRRSAWDVYSLFAVSGTLITTLMLLAKFHDRTFIQFQKLFLVSVALLIIPRNNQLDQLFKTGAGSLGSIVNLLATWFVFFLVYAIALTQTFGLTRFGDETSNNTNFRTVPKALILLFRTSVGEGWNAIMEDFARIHSPYCTVGERYFDGDCGSEQWARALFISWNILSMYIFVNLFISLIYENFSYVYQRSSGLSIISREEIRRFKQAWAEFDPIGTGYISKEAFPRFLGELSGVFEMRVYDGDFTVRALMDECQVDNPLRRTTSLPLEGMTGYEPREIDIAKLNAKLNEIPIDEIRRRRVRMNTFYEEVLVSADPDRGIEFGALLMILAHYKVINDNRSLKLEEFLRRRARLQRVEEAVNRNVVVGFFDTLYWSRRFRRAVESKRSARMTGVPTFGVPEIFVQDEAGDDVTEAKKFHVPSVSVTQVDNDTDTPQGLGVDRASSFSGSDAAGPSSWSRGEVRHRSNSIQTTPTGSPIHSHPSSPDLSPAAHRPSPSNNSIQPEWHFAAALENAITPPGSPRLTGGDAAIGRSRASSAVSQSGMMMDTFGTSAWGESMRRSVTTHRRTSDNNRRTTSSARQQSGSRPASSQRRPSAPRQYSSNSRPPSPPKQYSSGSRPPSPQRRPTS